jgi:hypothetical protein
MTSDTPRLVIARLGERLREARLVAARWAASSAVCFSRAARSRSSSSAVLTFDAWM